ncbi:MAG: hypothetical protein F4229_05035, partial [Gammaproteobacteria bacterium]|nr:hypothetical protein [Gammaproteobacteria bacterium]
AVDRSGFWRCWWVSAGRRGVGSPALAGFGPVGGGFVVRGAAGGRGAPPGGACRGWVAVGFGAQPVGGLSTASRASCGLAA